LFAYFAWFAVKISQTMILREILKKIRQIEIRTNRIITGSAPGARASARFTLRTPGASETSPAPDAIRTLKRRERRAPAAPPRSAGVPAGFGHPNLDPRRLRFETPPAVTASKPAGRRRSHANGAMRPLESSPGHPPIEAAAGGTPAFHSLQPPPQFRRIPRAAESSHSFMESSLC